MTESSVKQSEEEKEEESLKGTFISVFFVGGFIILVWLIVFSIYINRLS